MNLLIYLNPIPGTINQRISARQPLSSLRPSTMAALTVLSVLMCLFGLLAGASNAVTMTFIVFSPKLRKLTFGKLLLNLAVSGGNCPIL